MKLQIQYQHKLESKDWGEADIVSVSLGDKYIAFDIQKLSNIETAEAIIRAVEEIRETK